MYLKTVQNQLSAIFNHAGRYYNLLENPCKKAGSMGKQKNRGMLFWTKEQYLRFAEVMMDKPLSFYVFEMLYQHVPRRYFGQLIPETGGLLRRTGRPVSPRKDQSKKEKS